MANIKGSAVISRMKYIDEKGSPEKKEQILSKLSPRFQQEFKKSFLTIGWYSIDYITELVRAIDQVLGQGDGALYEDIGYNSAAQAIRGIYKLFFKLGSPEYIISKCPALWNQLMDSGAFYVTKVSKKNVLMGVKDFGVPLSMEVFLGLKGWTCALLEKSGAKNVQVEISKKPSTTYHGGEFAVKWD